MRLRPFRQRLLDFLVGFVLTQGIHRPDCRWDPADQRELENQAEDTRERFADGEEGKPRKKKGY